MSILAEMRVLLNFITPGRRHRHRHYGAHRGTCPPTFDLSWARGAQITDMKSLIHL